MATSNAIKAGQAFVEIFLKDMTVAGLNAVKKRLSSFAATAAKIGTVALGAGGAITGAITSAVHKFASAGDRIYEMSQRTGMSAEELSELKYAADLSGSSIENVERSVVKLSKSLVNAKPGDTIDRILAGLNLNLAELLEMRPADQFTLIADRISQMSTATERMATATALFGKSGAGLLTLFADGARGIGELREQAQRLGITLSGDSAKSAGILADMFDTLHAVIERLWYAVGEQVAPMFAYFTDILIQATVAVTDFIYKHPTLVKWVLIAGAVLTVIGGIMLSVAAAAAILAAGIEAVVAAVGLLASISGVGWLVILLNVLAAVVGGVSAWSATGDKIESFFKGIDEHATLAADSVLGLKRNMDKLSEFDPEQWAYFAFGGFDMDMLAEAGQRSDLAVTTGTGQFYSAGTFSPYGAADIGFVGSTQGLLKRIADNTDGLRDALQDSGGIEVN